MKKKNAQQPPSNGRFSGMVAVITGGAGGIGKNIARAFGREGAVVVFCDVDTAGGKGTETEFRREGISAEFIRVNLSRKGAPRALIQKVVDKYGNLDILVNNARSGKRLNMLEENERTWEEGMSVSLRAAFFASQEAVRAMSKTGGGNIVNVSSILAHLISHESAIYHIAKAGMAQMTRYVAAYAGPLGIRVNAVLPGFIIKDEHLDRYQRGDNERYRKITEYCHPLRKPGSAGNIADAVLFLCSEQASFISGQMLVVDGGLTLQEQSSLVYKLSEKKT